MTSRPCRPSRRRDGRGDIPARASASTGWRGVLEQLGARSTHCRATTITRGAASRLRHPGRRPVRRGRPGPAAPRRARRTASGEDGGELGRGADEDRLGGALNGLPVVRCITRRWRWVSRRGTRSASRPCSGRRSRKSLEQHARIQGSCRRHRRGHRGARRPRGHLVPSTYVQARLDFDADAIHVDSTSRRHSRCTPLRRTPLLPARPPGMSELRLILTVADVDEALAVFRDGLGLEQLEAWETDASRGYLLEPAWRRSSWPTSGMPPRSTGSRSAIVSPGRCASRSRSTTAPPSLTAGRGRRRARGRPGGDTLGRPERPDAGGRRRPADAVQRPTSVTGPSRAIRRKPWRVRFRSARPSSSALPVAVQRPGAASRSGRRVHAGPDGARGSRRRSSAGRARVRPARRSATPCSSSRRVARAAPAGCRRGTRSRTGAGDEDRQLEEPARAALRAVYAAFTVSAFAGYRETPARRSTVTATSASAASSGARSWSTAIAASAASARHAIGSSRSGTRG